MRPHLSVLLLASQLCLLPPHLARAEGEKAPSVKAYVATAEKDGWTDDALVKLYQMLPRKGAEQSPEFRKALGRLKLPDDQRPKQFFDALASYFDENRGGSFSAKKLDHAVETVTQSYVSLMKDSQTASGPQQELAGMMRVKSWKLLQKLQLFRAKLKQAKLSAWTYTRFTLPPAVESWDKEHTITSSDDFRKIVCEGSKDKPVLVKFGSTQCADCMLMEYVQSVHTLADRNKEGLNVYKIWWGPNLSKELDDLRKQEGVKSSPTFIMYRKGLRYPCGYQFPDDAGGGVESCIVEKTSSATRGACGTPDAG